LDSTAKGPKKIGRKKGKLHRVFQLERERA